MGATIADLVGFTGLYWGHVCVFALHTEAMTLQVLHTAINDLLQVQDWEYWEAMLQRIAYDEAEMEAFLVMHAQSKARLEQHRADKQAFEAAAPAEVTQVPA